MEYFVSFLEGVITFVSPCLLPMIPIYVTYFAAGEEQSTRTILKNALGFVLGFTIVFVCMGALAGTIGSFFLQYRIVLNIICGLVVIFFGLYFLGFIKINLFKGVDSSLTEKKLGFFSALVVRTGSSVGRAL